MNREVNRPWTVFVVSKTSPPGRGWRPSRTTADGLPVFWRCFPSAARCWRVAFHWVGLGHRVEVWRGFSGLWGHREIWNWKVRGQKSLEKRMAM